MCDINLVLLLSECNEAVQAYVRNCPFAYSLYPCTASSFCVMRKLKTVLPINTPIFQCVPIRNKGRKGTGCSHIHNGFYIGHLHFLVAYGHFPAPLVPVLLGKGCPDTGRLSREETARLMSAASTAMDSSDLFTVTNCRLSQNSATRSNN